MWLCLIENGLGGCLHLDGKLWEETERKWKIHKLDELQGPSGAWMKKNQCADGEILQIFNVFS